MKALFAAGGRATRLRPVTWTINKHLIPLAGKPMIVHAIEKVVEAGITEIAININPGDRELPAALGDGSAWGAHITYIEQQGGALGIAHAVKNAQDFLGDEPFLFYLADNILLGSLRRLRERFEQENLDVLLALAKVRDPQRFGVPVLENGRIVRVEEKPVHPASDFAVTGIYFYRPRVFAALEAIQPSARGEYEISDANTWLIEHGAQVGFEEISGWWKDTGTIDDLLEGNAFLLRDRPEWSLRIQGAIASGAAIRGAVSVGKNTVIGKNAIIRGPVSIGDDCQLDDCYIGPYTSLGNRVVVNGADIERSLVLDGSQVTGGARLAESLLGRNCRISRREETLPRGQRIALGDNAIVELM